MASQGDYRGSRLKYYDPQFSPALGTSPWELYPVLESLNDVGTSFEFTDDFSSLSTGVGGKWQVVKGTGGTLALRSSAPLVGGWADIPTAASSANDYQLLATQQPIFALAANNPICYEFSVQVTEANTNTASWAVGLSSTTTTGFLSNAGAPPSSYSGAMFWKATGALTLAFQTANATTKNTIASLATVVSGTNYVVGAVLLTNDNVTANVIPYVSTIVAGVRTLLVQGATQNLTIASLATMYLIAAIRTASANAETLSLDYAQCRAVR